MHAKLGFVSLLSLVATAYSSAVEFEYFKDHDCMNTQLEAVTLSGTAGCVNLRHPAKSFHIGGPSTDKQIPKGCTITGFSDKGCKGSTDVEIVGPSSKATCYITGVFMGNVAAANSVKMIC